MSLSIKEEVKQEKIILDLTGQQGNAFCVLGLAKKLSNKLGMDFDEIQKEMTANDYGHLIRTFEKHFGDFVDIQMSNDIMKQVNPFHHF